MKEQKHELVCFMFNTSLALSRFLPLSLTHTHTLTQTQPHHTPQLPYSCPVVLCAAQLGLNDETVSSCCFSMAWPKWCHIQRWGLAD